eukprot:GGOE01057386.1.p1 GENE.GGOE01057386.1~~GGOE01057386.1.p1  ORF type:complete len:1161 (+),score=425.88 GGOE01057386.1:201-3485(+)
MMQYFHQQAQMYGILQDLQSADINDWTSLVALVNCDKKTLGPLTEAAPEAKRPRTASVPTKAAPTSQKKLNVKPLPRSAASPPVIPTEQQNKEDELTQASNARTQQSKGLRQIARTIADCLQQGDDLTLLSSVNRQKVVHLAELHGVLQDVPLQDGDVNWPALQAKVEAMLVELERQRKQLIVARRKQRQAREVSPSKSDSASATSAVGKAAKKPCKSYKDTMEMKEDDKQCTSSCKRHKKAPVTPVPTTPAVQASELPHVQKMREMMDQFPERDTAIAELQSYSHQAGLLHTLFTTEDLALDENWETVRSHLDNILQSADRPARACDPLKVGRKKQRPITDDTVAVVKPGRKKQLPVVPSAVVPLKTGCPVLELDESTKVKLDALRQMRAIAWEDAHLLEGFSPDNLESIRLLEERHCLLGPSGATAFASYLSEGPRELLALMKSVMDKLEGARKKKKKKDAFEMMKSASKAMAKKERKKPTSAVESSEKESAAIDEAAAQELHLLKEAAALERQRKLDTEKAERERRAEELQRQREEAKRKREEEKEQRRLEKEEEKRKRDAERLQKKEEERRKKEEEKKGPPPKVLDAHLDHPTSLPSPCYRMDLDPALFQDIMLVYNFLYIFAEALKLTRFPFQLWVKAITAFNENKIIEEAFRQLVALCEEERSEKQPRRGGNWMGDATALLAETIGLSHERKNRSARGNKEESDSESSVEDANEDCMVCKKRNPLRQLLTCQLCDRFYHMNCVQPPVPVFTELWKCPECVEEAEAEEGQQSDKEKDGQAAQEATTEPDADAMQLKALCERAQELGRHNTYQNWGITERILWLKHLVRQALETETISELIRDNASQVAALWRDYTSKRRELQAEETASIRELIGKKEVEAEGEDEGEDEEKAAKAAEDGEDGEKEKGKKAPKDKEKEKKEKEEREKKRQEIQGIKERTRAKQDELLLKHRQAVDSIQSRVFPLGEDRHRRLYWRFPGDPHLWVQEVRGYTLAIPDQPQPQSVNATPLDEDDEEAVTDHTWGCFRTVDAVLEALDDRGIRESKLKATLEQLKWCDDRCPDRLELPRHFQLKYYFNRFKSSSHQKNPLEWA